MYPNLLIMDEVSDENTINMHKRYYHQNAQPAKQLI